MYSSQRYKLSKVLSKAQFYTELKQFKAAKILLENSLKEFGPTSNIYNQLGLIDYLESNFLEALEKFKKALSLNSSFVEAAYNLIACYCDLSMYEEAKTLDEQVKTAISQNPSSIPSLTLGRIADQHIQTGQYYNKSGLKIEAIREYEKAISIFPQLSEGKYELAQLRIETGQYEQAKDILARTIKDNPNNPDLYSLYATAYLKQGRNQDAIELLNKALHINPHHHLSRTLLSSISS